MSDYNYRSLSGFEFERVVRDLMQEEHGVVYQTSPPGPDGGVDLRHVAIDGKVTIIQCKHYINSSVSTLVSHLRRKEVSKVQALQPERYMLVTSLDLSPSVKDEIAALFTPYCKSTNDVVGGLDVSNLLGRHQSVADRHVKLWLTSEPVLRRVLQAGIFDDSEREVERIRRRLALYVPNPSFGRAQSVLDEQHVCIIAGIPGIGKTTLAQMLLIDYESRGYSVVRIPNYLSQVMGAARRGSRTIFYFDDFLGQTVLERWERNEDQRLVEFMLSVRNEADWRFVLTTREYILEEARLKSEALSRLRSEANTCVITLDEDYTPEIRALVLYQHLYFSDLPASSLLALLRSDAIHKILAHRNYSPRLIDLLTSQAYTSPGASEDYPDEFLRTLDDPQRLWGVAYRAMNSAAQDLVLTMASLPEPVHIEHLQASYESFRAHRARRFNHGRAPDEFEQSLRVLDGTMVRTQTRQQGRNTAIVVSFHNPSIRDFVQSKLRDTAADTADLLESGIYLDQYIRLFQGDGNEPYPQILRNPDSFTNGVTRVIAGGTIHLHSNSDRESDSHNESWESRALFAYDVANTLATPAAQQLQNAVFRMLQEHIVATGKADISAASKFLRSVYKVGGRDHNEDEQLVDKLLSAILSDLYWDTDVNRLLELYKSANHLFKPHHIREAKQAIRTCAVGYADNIFSPATPSLFFEAAAALRAAAKRFKVDIRDVLEVIEERGRDAEEEPDEDNWTHGNQPQVEFPADELFLRLQNEISSREE